MASQILAEGVREERTMEEWKRLEFEYARRLREAPAPERRALYNEAYSKVSELANARFTSEAPEDRTAGTSKANVQAIAQRCRPDDDILEIGCGRGYTCLELAPYVRSIVGTDVSEPVLSEARQVMVAHGVSNVTIQRVGACDLTDHFPPESFTAALSIDVVEHLHPEDAKEHLAQVFRLLKPGGRYMIFMPNRLTGPHDITCEEFPNAREPLGFHLNESTYTDMIRQMKRVGYARFQSLLWTKAVDGSMKRVVTLPARASRFAESFYVGLPPRMRHRVLGRVLHIRLVGYKPA